MAAIGEFRINQPAHLGEGADPGCWRTAIARQCSGSLRGFITRGVASIEQTDDGRTLERRFNIRTIVRQAMFDNVVADCGF